MFDRIIELNDVEIQELIKNIDLNTLLVALQGSGLEIGKAFRRNFSDSALELLSKEYFRSTVFAANKQDIDRARQEISNSLRKLIREKKITSICSV